MPQGKIGSAERSFSGVRVVDIRESFLKLEDAGWTYRDPVECRPPVSCWPGHDGGSTASIERPAIEERVLLHFSCQQFLHHGKLTYRGFFATLDMELNP